MEPIRYACGETVLTGYLARPSHPWPAPGVLVAHQAIGVGVHARRRAEALAALGYIAFALDLYGEEGFPREQQGERHRALMETPGLLLDRALAGLDVLSSQPGIDPARLGAIGFCQGGATVLELARAGAPIRCAIGFHPGYVRPVDSAEGSISAKILMMSGADDPLATPDRLAGFTAEMTAKRADWQLHLFGGVGHTFTDPDIDALGLPGFAWDPTADRRSWTLMRSLLEDCFADDPGAAS